MGFRRITLSDGRALCLDDVGDPDGHPVVYLHGNPDARQARHPDDDVAGLAGVRLLAIDRPGFGDSDLNAVGDLRSLGHDLGDVLDALGIATASLLGWSSGGLAALGAASVLGARVDGVQLVAPVPPVEGYRDAAVVAALGPARRPFAELAFELTVAELAGEVAPYLLPDPLTDATAREHVLDGAGAVGRAELASVPGSVDRLVAGLMAAGAHGLGGVEQDLRQQLEPGLELVNVSAPVAILQGGADSVSPPAVGRWLAARVPQATVEVVDGAGHHLLFPRWGSLMRSLGAASAG